MKSLLSLAKLSLNLLLNLALSPVYLVVIITTTILAVSHIFPARVSRTNLRRQKNAGTVSAVIGTSAVLTHYFLILIEDFVFWPLGGLIIKTNSEVKKEIMNASTFAADSQRGLAVLSAHFGNIEVSADSVMMTAIRHVHPNSPLIALAKPSRSQLATSFLAWYRRRRGLEIIQTNRKDLVRTMIQGFKHKRAIALLVDQKPARLGLFIEFFGTPAAFPEGGIEVAVRSQAEIVCFTSRRIFPGIYTYEGRWLKDELKSTEPVKKILEAYAAWLESVIHKSPWQWCWDYKKWSRVQAPLISNFEKH
ncbi:MAG: hypothetical protein RJB13_741 [Pseudomonadota bacterium]